MLQLLLWMKTAALPVSTLAVTAGLSADFHEVLTAASLPYPLLVSAARSCSGSLPLSVDKSLRIKAVHSLSRAVHCIWPNCLRYEAMGDVLPLKQAIAEAQEASMDSAAILNMQSTMATMYSGRDSSNGWMDGSQYILKALQHRETFEPVYR